MLIYSLLLLLMILSIYVSSNNINYDISGSINNIKLNDVINATNRSNGITKQYMSSELQESLIAQKIIASSSSLLLSLLSLSSLSIKSSVDIFVTVFNSIIVIITKALRVTGNVFKETAMFIQPKSNVPSHWRPMFRRARSNISKWLIKLGVALHFTGDSFLFLWSSLETILLFLSVTTTDSITTATNALSYITFKVMKTVTIANNNNNTTNTTRTTSNLSLLQSSSSRIKPGLVLPKKASTTNAKGAVLDKIVKNFPTDNPLASSSISPIPSSSLSSNQFKMPVVNSNIRPILNNIYNDNNDNNVTPISSSRNTTINKHNHNDDDSMILLLWKTFVMDTGRSLYKYLSYDNNSNTSSSSSSNSSSSSYSIAPHLFTCLCILSYIVSRKYSNVYIQIITMIITILLVFLYVTALDNLFKKKILTSIGIDAINDFVNKHPESYPYSSNKKGLNRAGKFDYEVSNWFNIISGAIWNIEGTNEIGGCGPYLAKSIEKSLNMELARVPQGIAKLQLKNFNLGTKSPVVRALKVIPYRIPDTACTKTNNNINNNNKNIGSKMQGELRKLYEKLNHNQHDNKDIVSKGCEHLIIEIDVGYVSKEMDIILSLRSNDINSVLPEAFVTVSTLAMAGIITVDSELIPEYPFFGNATFSFKELPSLDMTLSSFGGIDLSAIPGVRNFIDISLKWLMSQYTNPNVGSINMIQYLCPTCLEIETKQNYIELMMNRITSLYSYIKKHV